MAETEGAGVVAGGGSGTPTIVEPEVCGRRAFDVPGERVRPVGAAEAGPEAERDAESAIGVSPGSRPLPPVKAIRTPTTTATSTAPAVTINSTPRPNRISSSRASTAARSAEGRPCLPDPPAARLAEGVSAGF